MNFFDWMNNALGDNRPNDAMAVAVKKQSNPSSTLFATTILMLTELSKTQEGMLARSESLKLAKRAEKLGFTNSYTVAEQKQFNQNVELLRFMLEMWRDLGRNAILIGYDQFRDLLRRHDLMCVSFDAYKGDIPVKNMEEIECAMSRLKILGDNKDYRFYRHLTSRSAIVSTSEALLDMLRFPYYCGREDYAENSILFKITPQPQGCMFIAAPKDFVEKPCVERYKAERNRWFISREDEERINNEITAANRILRGVEGYANVKYSTKPKPLPINYDPFVCSLCSYGVIIHSMWGAEAEDATIKRYEQLRDAIIGKGGAI